MQHDHRLRPSNLHNDDHRHQHSFLVGIARFSSGWRQPLSHAHNYVDLDHDKHHHSRPGYGQSQRLDFTWWPIVLLLNGLGND